MMARVLLSRHNKKNAAGAAFFYALKFFQAFNFNLVVLLLQEFHHAVDCLLLGIRLVGGKGVQNALSELLAVDNGACRVQNQVFFDQVVKHVLGIFGIDAQAVSVV